MAGRIIPCSQEFLRDCKICSVKVIKIDYIYESIFLCI